MKRIISILLIAVMLTGCTQEINTASLPSEPPSSSPETSSALESSAPSSKASAPASSAPAKPLTNDELLEQLKNGDIPVDLIESDYPTPEKIKKYGSGIEEGVYSEWIQMDVNNDGFDDLILQDIDEYNPELKRIFAIYSAETGKVRCHLWDENDLTEYYFVAKNRNIIYCAPDYGTLELDFYKHYTFDKDWNRVFVEGVMLYGIYDYGEVDSEEWRKDHPDITTEGIYYYDMIPVERKDGKGPDNKEVPITKEQFEEKFEKILGVPFEEMKPWWIDEWDFS